MPFNTPRLMIILMLLLISSIAGISVSAQERVIDTEDRRTYAVPGGDFAFYREMVESAIADQGMVVNNVGRIAEMLDRTGADLGGGTQLYLHGESIEFCSAIYSRRMMEADPHSIVFCPYVIAVYELAAEPGTVYIGYQRLPRVDDPATQQALQDVETLLERIVQAAMEF